MEIRSSYPRSEERSGGHARLHQEENMAGLILLGLCFSHLLNDTIQSLIPAIYPVLKMMFRLDFGEIGLITLTFQLISSLLQPLVGTYTDHKPKPFSLAIGMGVSLCGLLLLSRAWDYAVVLLAAGLAGVVLRSFILKQHVLLVSALGAGMVLPNRSFNLEFTWAQHSDPHSQQSSWFPEDSIALPGFQLSRCLPSSCWAGLAFGTEKSEHLSKRNLPKNH